MIREGFPQEIQALKEGAGKNLSGNSLKERAFGPSYDFLVLKNEGFQGFGSQDAGEQIQNNIIEVVGQYI